MVHGFSSRPAITASVPGTTGQFVLSTALDRGDAAPAWHRIFQPAARRIPGRDEHRGRFPLTAVRNQ